MSAFLRGLACALVALATLLPVPTAAQGFKWWHDETFRKELGLTPEQSTRIESLFQDALPTLRKRNEDLDRAQAEFDRLVERADDATVMAQVSAVETARAEVNKARVMMLLKMRRALTSDQWAKFTALRQGQDRRQGRDGRQGPR